MTSTFYATFADRHIGPSQSDTDRILRALGYASLDALSATAVPDNIALPAGLSLAPGASEPQVIAELRDLAAAKLRHAPSEIGQRVEDVA